MECSLQDDISGKLNQHQAIFIVSLIGFSMGKAGNDNTQGIAIKEPVEPLSNVNVNKFQAHFSFLVPQVLIVNYDGALETYSLDPAVTAAIAPPVFPGSPKKS